MENRIMDSVRYKILLIEDNELDQMDFKRFFEDNDLPYDCTVSGSVSEAKRVLGAAPFDIIITDHSLGDGTALEILDLAGDTPVIVATGAGNEETAIKVWEAGAYDYMIKDANQNYLKDIPMTVENAIRQNMVEKKLHLLLSKVPPTGE
jgi:DNA-binding NtrC family response regulator